LSNFKWGFTSAICALCISALLGVISGVAFVHIVLRAVIFFAVFFGLGFALWFVINSFFPELLYKNEENASSQIDEDGGHISIAMDSAGEYAVPELFNKPGDSQEIGNIEDLVSGSFKRRPSGDNFPADNQSAYPGLDFSMSSDEGIDRNKEAGYNDLEALQNVTFRGSSSGGTDDMFETPVYEKPADEKSAAFQPQFTPSFGDDSGLGGLPDLDMMAMAFSSNYSGAPAPAPSTAALPASSTPVIHPVEEFEPDRSQYKGNKPQTLQGDFNPKSLAEGIRTVLSKG
jgi:hypothetical protein